MTERYKNSFESCYKVGRDALIIKAADFFDNADYYDLTPNNESRKWLLQKLKYFIDNPRDELKDETIYKKLVEKYKRTRSSQTFT